MLASSVFLCSFGIVAHCALEELKQEVFTVDNTGKWKGKLETHVPTIDLEPIKGGGWDGVMWTTHGISDDHYIGKHWVEDADGNVIVEQDFGPHDGNSLNQQKNQTTKFKVQNGAKEPLTTYAWCNVHGTWSHTWTGVQLSHSEDDAKVDDRAEQQSQRTPLKALNEVPQHPKVSSEEVRRYKSEVFTAESVGRWKGQANRHVPQLDLHPVQGGGWIAELETTHRKETNDYVAKHWLEDGAGDVLGAVDFDFEGNDESNGPDKQVSKFFVPKGAVEPLTTFAYCPMHGAWSHTWQVPLDSPEDEL